MNQAFMRNVFVLCLLLVMVSFGAFGQVFSLDDDPSGPATGPLVPPYSSAEDEFGLGLPAWVAGFIGPSPSLFNGPFFDSDVLAPGPLLSMRFQPAPTQPPVQPPQSPSPYFVDAYSADHSLITWYDYSYIWLRFSVDRASGGITPSDATYVQASVLDQPADIFQGNAAFAHPGFFIPLPLPLVPPWSPVFGGALPTAGGGGSNVLIYDNLMNFGLIAGPMMFPGSHDNIDAYNEMPANTMKNQDIFFALHPAEAIPRGLSPSDIFYSPSGPLTFIIPPFAFDWQIGLTAADSIDALVVWDYNGKGVCEPGIDYALFSLAPGSPTLAAVNSLLVMNGFPGGADGGAVFLTDFSGYFYLYAQSGDIGVGPLPVPPLPRQPTDHANVDALEIWLSGSPE